MSLQGIRTVAALELRQRRRTSRWPLVLGAWVVLVALVTWLTWRAVLTMEGSAGSTLYDVLTFFVLGLSMLIMPSLTATSINGDREHGVLATLQTTLLSPGDIVVGKLVASVTVALAFLATALPFLAIAYAAGGLSFGRILLSLLVLVLVLSVVCAVGLMFSSLTARPVSSAVLTYLSVAGLVFGTVIAFGLTAFLVMDTEQVKVHGVPEAWYQEHQGGFDPNGNPVAPTSADCTVFTRPMEIAHTERIWWLLPLNPFVVVADAAPPRPAKTTPDLFLSAFTPMQWISDGARQARRGADLTATREECYFGDVSGEPPPESSAGQTSSRPASGPVWPFGLAFLLVVGAGATTISVLRTRTPIRRLPNGTRIA
jgi:ABC-type transport system involved in multi-copper enzyme maturation permease subunit